MAMAVYRWRGLLLLVAGLCCLFAACGGDNDDDDDTGDDDAGDDDAGDDDAGDDDIGDDDDDCAPRFPDLLLAAHRGATLFAPENTLPAIEKALELGVEIVEMDVRHTADGHYVLMHDDTVDRTTDGGGPVSEMTLEEVRALRIDHPLFGWLYSDLGVPTFAEALAVIDAYGGQAYVDLKSSEPEGAVEVIVDLGLEAACFVYSGSVEKLDRVRSVSGDVRIQPSTGSVEETQALIDHFDPDPEHIEIDGEAGFTQENIDLIHSIGAAASMDALGVRDILAVLGFKQAWLTMMERGVDLIQTDFPGSLAGYREGLCE